MTNGPAPAPGTPQGSDTTAQQIAAQIAAQAQMRSQTQSLAEALIPQTQPGAILVKGKVVAWSTGFPPTVTIQLGGDASSQIAAVRYVDSYTPVVGDTVIIAKQGAEILVLGKVHEFYDNQPAKNGWLPLNPQTTWNGSNNTSTPPLWRRVFDHGERKIQMQGRVWRSSGNPTGTIIATLPAGYRPGIVRTLMAARENFGGANEVQLNITPNGNIEVVGHTLSTATAQHGGVDTNNVDLKHWHKVDHSGNHLDNDWTSDPYSGIWTGVLGYPGGLGSGGMQHRHTTNSATHSHTAGFPGWISLDGIEFFL